MLTKASLILSGNGDSFHPPFIFNGDVRTQVDFAVHKVHPELENSQTCKTHESVLAFLKKVENNSEFHQSVTLYHPYGHELRRDTLLEAISFVEQRIRDVKTHIPRPGRKIK